MKNIIPIFLMYLPLVLLAQNSLEKSRVEDRAKWVGVRERIEGAVERGEITREQADERYAGFRRRMAKRNDENLGARRENLNKREQNTDLAEQYKKLGISNLNRIKNGLVENGITNIQLDAVMGAGMLRVIREAKAEGDDFEMSPRIKIYFQDRIGLTQEQIKYVEDVSVRIARRVR